MLFYYGKRNFGNDSRRQIDFQQPVIADAFLCKMPIWLFPAVIGIGPESLVSFAIYCSVYVSGLICIWMYVRLIGCQSDRNVCMQLTGCRD